MKSIIKILVSVLCFFILFSFSKKENPEARKLLNGFKSYVDTIVLINSRSSKTKQAQ